MAVATGQFTIVDYNDALTLTGYINSNQPKTQQFNPDTGGYAPDWSSTNLVLTPSLFILGTSGDIIGNAAVTAVQWFDGSAPSTPLTNNSDYAISASSPYSLTIKTNKLAGLPSKDYIVQITYHDSSTNLNLTYKTSISFSRVVNGGGIADAVCWAPKGNVFKNGTVSSLILHCDLWRGSTIDTSLVTYAWYQQDSSVVTDQGAGVGWKKLSDVANMVTGTATNEITIYPNQVLTYGVFKCQIKDTDSASNTYNQYFYDTCTIADQSDPIQLSIVSTGGDTFKNGAGSSTLVVKVFQAGVEIDALPGTMSSSAPSSPTTNQYWLDTANCALKQWNGSAWVAASYTFKYTYTWTVFDKDGNTSIFNGGASSKTGKFISVGDLDVSVKATFQVTVS